MSKRVAFMLLLAACDSDEVTTAPATPTATTAATAPAPVAPAAAVTPAPPAPPTIAPARVTASPWRDRVAADIAELRASSPQLLAELTSLAPTVTRARSLRFTSDSVHDPRAAAVFLDRLSRGGDSDEVRAALVEALPRTGGVFADAAIDLIATETSPLVRGAYVFAARRAPGAPGLALIERGLADRAPEVQAEAARSAAAHTGGPQLATHLRKALASSDPTVRSEVARSLGILKIADARESLVAMLDDASADVRLESLRAIDRIQPGSAKSLPLGKLASDTDPRIASLVARLTASEKK